MLLEMGSSFENVITVNTLKQWFLCLKLLIAKVTSENMVEEESLNVHSVNNSGYWFENGAEIMASSDQLSCFLALNMQKDPRTVIAEMS